MAEGSFTQVMQDPNNPGHYIPNTIRLDRSISSQYLGTDPPTAAFIYDASFIKLRQVSVSYTFNKNFLKIQGFRGLRLALQEVTCGSSIKTFLILIRRLESLREAFRDISPV